MNNLARIDVVSFDECKMFSVLLHLLGIKDHGLVLSK